MGGPRFSPFRPFAPRAPGVSICYLRPAISYSPPMPRTRPSSRQVPLALAIVLLIAAALFCFAAAIALGIGFYYLANSWDTGNIAEATPTPFASSTPEYHPTPVSPAATPIVSITPFATISPSFTPFPSVTTTPSNPANPSTPSAELDEYGFRTTQIHIENKTLDVELAQTPAQHAKGLRFRQTLAENAGMLFIFPSPQRVSFWMKDASIPLSIAYIQANGKIVQIRPMQPYDKTPVPSLSDSIAYALLVNQGWFEHHGITAGSVIEDLPR
jgi:uncharacterized protein